MDRPSSHDRCLGKGRRISGVAVLFCLGLRASHAAPLFEDTVAPLLKARCVECHNPSTRRGELDLSSPAGLRAGSESGPVFVAGEPEKSLLYELAHRGEMPKKGDDLSHDEVELIRAWIAGGAEFREVPPTLTKSPPHQHEVIPLMLLRCAACHGAQRQDGGLDLRTPASMRAGGTSGPAFVAGDPDASRMIQRIESESCPPQELLLKFFVKRPPSNEVTLLREWIAAGAPEQEIQPDVATTAPDPLVSDEDRKHWSFQPPKRPATGNSVDDFIGTKLAGAGLDFAPEADRDTLIRRAFLDLTGLPPSPEDWQYWKDHPDEDWFAELVDRLLDSPHYGERWGRIWLDVAGYSDSEGGLESDPVRETAWKYRDYVVQAFNEDKPYDRFLLEQIAGDELVDHAKTEEVTDEMVENLVATGFLRMGVDQTGSRTMNFTEDRLGVIYDAIKVLGSGVMGLTLECARCHTHKYDPIPQRDYFRLKAVFQGALDEHDWLSFKNRNLDAATPAQLERASLTNPPLEGEIEALEKKLTATEAAAKRELMRLHYPGISEADEKETLVALRKAPNVRSLHQAQLVEKYRLADLVPDAGQPATVLASRQRIEEMRTRLERLRAQLAPTPSIRALWDRGDPSPTYLLRRGEHDKPSRLVGPGVLSVLTDGQTPFVATPPFPDGTPKTGRRLAFAQWLTDPAHPLTARVMVNRIWHHHFGTGIVRSLENFGNQGARPTHPELLDWLAVEFVESGWSVKEMHRLIMDSRAYRQSSVVAEDRLAKDPENRLVSRMNLRRLDAERLHDALLAVSGKLDERAGGAPDPVSIDRDGLVLVKPQENGKWRRSLYALHRRTEMPTMLETFDYPEMGPNCVERSVSTVSPQALYLLNNARVRELAAALAVRVERQCDGETDPVRAWVEAVYPIVFGRLPSAEERTAGIEALRALEREWSGDEARALETYCHTLLNSAAFVYLD
jgi:mono/diheme cytochrome c family protein